MWLSTKNGFVNSAHVVSVDGDEGTMVLTTGETVKLLPGNENFDDMMFRANKVVIPANPGFHVLELSYDDGTDKYYLDKFAVIAWLVDSIDGYAAHAVTPNGVYFYEHSANVHYAVETPNGLVLEPEHQSLTHSVDEWVEGVKVKLKRRIEKENEQRRKRHLKLVSKSVP